jgi:hypothetical protein
VSLVVTGSAAHARLRILLPKDARGVSETLVNSTVRPSELERVRDSLYATVAAPLNKPVTIEVRYR